MRPPAASPPSSAARPVVVIDHVDSFVYNLARYLQELGRSVEVLRHDRVGVADVVALDPSHIVLSPGPLGPEQTLISKDLILHRSPTWPILGVCLGHQTLGWVYGGRIRRTRPIHGRVWSVWHAQQGLFAGLPNPLRVTRYHSLVVDSRDWPRCLLQMAWAHTPAVGETAELDLAFPPAQPQAFPPAQPQEFSPAQPQGCGVIDNMAFVHESLPHVGVQFHPESIGSEFGHEWLRRFLALGDHFNATGHYDPLAEWSGRTVDQPVGARELLP